MILNTRYLNQFPYRVKFLATRALSQSAGETAVASESCRPLWPLRRGYQPRCELWLCQWPRDNSHWQVLPESLFGFCVHLCRAYEARHTLWLCQRPMMIAVGIGFSGAFISSRMASNTA
jgi:hypothetical protein